MADATQAAPQPVAAAPKPPRAPQVSTDAGPDAERAPRKRRRRRGGKRVEGAGTDAMPAAKPQPSAQIVATRASKPGAKPSRATEAPSLLSRIKRRLEAIVTRGPRSEH